jgi:hypothetical protein
VIIHLKQPQDAGAVANLNDLVGGLQGLSVQAAGNRYQQTALYTNPSYTSSIFASGRAPQGNPFAAPAAYQFPPSALLQQFVPPSPALTAQNSLMHSRGSSLSFGGMSGFGPFHPRRNQISRFGRGGPARGLNNVVDLNELIAGRDVRTTVSSQNPFTTSVTSDLLPDHAAKHSQQGGSAPPQTHCGRLFLRQVRFHVPSHRLCERLQVSTRRTEVSL